MVDASWGGAFTQVDVSPELACALRTDGTAACWGIPSGVGADDPPAGRFTAVSAGASHACGLRPSGEIECWGNHGFGRTDAPAGRFVSVSAGAIISCAVSVAGGFECWGRLSQHPPGWIDKFQHLYDYPLRHLLDPPAGRFTSIDRYAHPSLGLCGVIDGSRVECWGNTGFVYTDQPADRRFSMVAAGYTHACGLRPSGVIDCWGDPDVTEAPRP